MSYLEHEIDKGADCGCPSCDLFNEYLKGYAKFKRRNQYLSFEMEDDIRFDLDEIMNTQCKAGYELAYVIPGHNQHNRVVVLRAVPPPTPNAADVIEELNLRTAACKDKKDVNIDEIGPTIGEA